MRNLIKKTLSIWENKLKFDQRRIVVQMYVNGISISAISDIYQVHRATIRYHLTVAGVYIKDRRSTITLSEIKSQNEKSNFAFHNARGGTKKTVVVVADVFERKLPKSYKEYLELDKLKKRERQRTTI